ncbi:MAG: DUF4145 domain-containing protein [Pseudomonadota bacterium]
MDNNSNNPVLVFNCPRCNAEKMTFDVLSHNHIYTQYGWQQWYELFCICRNCHKATIFRVSQKNSDSGVNIYTFNDPKDIMKFKGSLNRAFGIEGYINLRDNNARPAPEFVPEDVKTIFEEGTACTSIKCWNAAGSMFRQCLDLVSKSLLPKEEVDGLTGHIRSKLGARLNWLFKNNYLPKDLQELAECVREDGNDGAHDGTLMEADSLNLLDFTEALLERIYTEKEKIEQAKQRRISRRQEVSS